MSLKSVENRNMLCNVLLEHPLRKIDNVQFELLLDSFLERTHNERFKYRNNLLVMNKKILNDFQNVANQINLQYPHIEQQHSGQQHQHTLRQTQQASRQNMFEQRLKEKQESFNKLIKKKAPKNIDFADKMQDKPMETSSIDNTMAQREKELNEIMDKQQKNARAEQWVNGDKIIHKKSLKNLTRISAIKKLTIDTSSNIKINPIKINNSKRRITFEPMAEDFLRKLKPKIKTQPKLPRSPPMQPQPNNQPVSPPPLKNDITSTYMKADSLLTNKLSDINNLNKILENQRIIIDLLQQLNAKNQSNVNTPSDVNIQSDVNTPPDVNTPSDVKTE